MPLVNDDESDFDVSIGLKWERLTDHVWSP